jgi:hypothetical protein
VKKRARTSQLEQQQPSLNSSSENIDLPRTTRTIRKDHAMGDKGGKKDKDKSKKQKASKQEQVMKTKQDKNRPK